MADNLAISQGVGTTVATDDISNVHYQRVKLSLGADGVANDASAGAGAVGTGTQRVTLASDDPVTTAVQIMDDWDRTDACKVVNTHAGATVTLSLDTSAYANGDLLADTQAVNAAFRIADGTGVIEAIQLLDEDDQTLYSFTVYLLSSAGSMGSENSAPAPADADARTICGFVDFATTDGKDLGNSKVYYKGGLNIPVKAISGTDDLGVAVVIGTGTPTHSATGITMILWIKQD